MLRELEVVTEFIIGGHSLNKVRWTDDGKHRKKKQKKTPGTLRQRKLEDRTTHKT